MKNLFAPHIFSRISLTLLLIFLPALALLAQEDAAPSYQIYGSAFANFTFKGIDLTDQNDPAADWSYGIALDMHHQLSGKAYEARLDHRILFSDETLSNTISEAYLMVHASDSIDISLGKKRVNFGLGSIFNPADSIHPLEQVGQANSGFYGLITRLSLGQEWGISAAVSLDRIFNGQAAPAIGGLDYLLSTDIQLNRLAFGAAWLYGYSASNTGLIWLSYDFDGLIIGGEASLDFNPRAWKPENGSMVQQNDPRFSSVVDLSWEHSWDDAELTLKAAWLFNGEGWSKNETEQWQAMGANMALRPRPYLNQHYIKALIDLRFPENLTVKVHGLFNLEDASGRVGASLAIELVSDLDLEIDGLFHFGETNSEFCPGLIPRYMASVGARLHW